MHILKGHVAPGTFFILLATWQTIQALRRYFQCHNKKRGQQIEFRSSMTYPIQTCCGSVQLDGYLVIVTTAIGFHMQLPFQEGMSSIQHATLYSFFTFSALCALILPKLRVFPDSDRIVYALVALSFTAGGLLFHYHLAGRTAVDQLVHILLSDTMFACAIATLVEIKYRGSIMIVLARLFLAILTGTWFWQIGFLLYPPGSIDYTKDMNASSGGAMDGPEYIMYIACLFAWHMLGDFIFILLCTGCVGLFYRKKGQCEEGLLEDHDQGDN